MRVKRYRYSFIALSLFLLLHQWGLPGRAAVRPGGWEHDQALMIPLRPIVEESIGIDQEQAVPVQGSTWSTFQSAYPGAWWGRLDARTMRPSLIWGCGIPWIAGSGNSLTDSAEPALSQLEHLARGFMGDHPGFFRVDQRHLLLNEARSAKVADGTFRYVDFDFAPNGIPALHARIFFRINHGNLIQFGSHGIIDPAGLPTEPRLSRETALERARERIRKVYPSDSRLLEPGTLVYVPIDLVSSDGPGNPREKLTYRLCWNVSFEQHGSMATWLVYIDALSGDIIALFDANLYACDPAVHLRGEVTGGVYPVSPFDAEESWRFPDTLVQTDAGGVVTDGNGIFPYTSGEAWSELNGPYFSIVCAECSNPAGAHGSNHLGTAGGVMLGNGGGEKQGNGFSTRPERNTFYHLNLVRATAKKWLDIPWFDSPFRAVVNEPGSCNGFFKGSEIILSSSSIDCHNAGEVSGVIYHEWGHGLDRGTGYGGPGGRGEGVADLTAYYVNHDVDYCMGFWKSGEPLRILDETTSPLGLLTATNVANICGGNPPFRAHCHGQLLSQTFTRLTRNLVNKYGEIGGWHVAEKLFFGSLPGSTTMLGNEGGSQYDAVIAVDDDDGNLANGTPNAGEINDAFVAHEIQSDPVAIPSTPCPPPASPSLSASHQSDPVTGIFQIHLSWNSVPGAAHYNLYRNLKSPTGAYLPLALGTTDTQYVDHDVKDGVTYHYTVMAESASGCLSLDAGWISVTIEPEELVVDGYQIDDSTGGNGNGIIELGEPIDLILTLKNLWSGTMTNVTVTLGAVDPAQASISTDISNFGDIPGYGLGASNVPHLRFTSGLDPIYWGKDILVTALIESEQGCWLHGLALPVSSGRTDLVLGDITLDDKSNRANGNGSLEPGEQVTLFVGLRNTGALAANNVSAEITSVHPGVTFDTALAQYGSIPVGEERGPLLPAHSLTLAYNPTFCGDEIELLATIRSDDGIWSGSFTLSTGSGERFDTIFFDDFERTGPDWIHNATGGSDYWERGFPGKGMGIEPDRPYSGEFCYGTDLGNGTDGNYSPDDDMWLMTPQLDLSSYDTVFLSFHHWLTLEGANDIARIKFRQDTAWNNEVGVDRHDTEWSKQTVDISAAAAGVSGYRVQFNLRSNDLIEFGGWNIDDVHIYAPICELPLPRAMIVHDSFAVDDGITAGIGNADQIADPGERVALVLNLANLRNATATEITARLCLAQPIPGIDVLTDLAYFGDIAPGDVQPSLAPHVIVGVDPAVPCGTEIPLQTHVTYTDGISLWSEEFQFVLRIGRLDIGSGPEEAIFFDNLETGRGEWRHGLSGGQDDWMLGWPTPKYLDDAGWAYSGTHVWGNDLGATLGDVDWDGRYGPDVLNFLDSPAVDCSRHEQIRLRYWRWLTVEDGMHDRARIRVNGTVAWESPAGSGTDHFMDMEWTRHELDISSLADGRPSVVIRFELETNGTVEMGGWNIDNVELVGVPKQILCTPYQCNAPPPDPVGSTLRCRRENYEVRLSIPGYSGSARLFNLYEAERSDRLPALDASDLLLKGADINRLTDPNVYKPGVHYYQLRAVNECGVEE